MSQNIRSSDVFLKEDVRCMLQAILATNEELARQFADPAVQTYRHGFAAAVAAVAVAFNIQLDSPRRTTDAQPVHRINCYSGGY